MLTLFHYPLSAPSRYIRLLLHEYNVPTGLVLEDEWRQRPDFRRLNLAGTVPVLLEESGLPICGADVICEYLDETRSPPRNQPPFFPQNPQDRAEVRRLCHWFLDKCNDETARPLIYERIIKQNIPPAAGGGAPNSAVLRLARANIKPHLDYLNWLIRTRHFIGNAGLSYADFAAAATISALDYLGEIDWNIQPQLGDWYSRLKSRPSFRPLLADRLREMAPASHYANLDF